MIEKSFSAPSSTIICSGDVSGSAYFSGIPPRTLEIVTTYSPGGIPSLESFVMQWNFPSKSVTANAGSDGSSQANDHGLFLRLHGKKAGAEEHNHQEAHDDFDDPEAAAQRLG